MKNNMRSFESRVHTPRAQPPAWQNKSEPAKVGRCFSCGKTDHKFANCPDKEKGMKCFACNDFGHAATKCPKKESIRQQSLQVQDGSRSKMLKDVKISGIPTVALIDTGSSVNLVTSDEYFHIGAPLIKKEIKKLYGLGFAEVETKGCFDADIEIDGNIFATTIHVVENVALPVRCSIGTELLNKAQLTITHDVIKVVPLSNDVRFVLQIQLSKEETSDSDEPKSEKRSKKRDVSSDRNTDVEKLEKERQERERLERERLEKERLERERIEKEGLGKEQLEREQRKRETERKEKEEKERREREEQERLENERRERREKEEREKREREEREKREKQEQEEEKRDLITREIGKLREIMKKQEEEKEVSRRREKDEKKRRRSRSRSRDERSRERELERERERERDYKKYKKKKRTQFGPGLKVHPKYLGPYKVSMVNDHDRYVVEKVGVGEGPVHTTSSADQMKMWQSNLSSSEDDEQSTEEDSHCPSEDPESPATSEDPERPEDVPKVRRAVWDWVLMDPLEGDRECDVWCVAWGVVRERARAGSKKVRLERTTCAVYGSVKD